MGRFGFGLSYEFGGQAYSRTGLRESIWRLVQDLHDGGALATIPPSCESNYKTDKSEYKQNTIACQCAFQLQIVLGQPE